MANFFTGLCHDGNPSDDRTTATLFGICDDPPVAGVLPKRAYIDTANPNRWIARVINSAAYDVVFKGVDYCILITRPNGTPDKRCDGMLIYNHTIIFVELKERNSGWLEGGGEQLQVTIDNFRSSHSATSFTKFKAHLANSKRPLFQQGHQSYINRFFNNTNVVLRVEADIVL